MKKSLGKTVLFLLLLLTHLQAKTLASYTLTSNNANPYEKEPFSITFVAKQQDHHDNMMFLLKPKASPLYTIKLLSKAIDDKTYHNNTTTFTYLVVPLKAQKLHVGFDFTIQTASDKAVAHSYVDDHDDSIAIETYNTKMDVTPLTIEVKKLDHAVDLVGDFTLEEHLSQKQMDQYGSINIIYTLKGEGYEAKDIAPITSINDVTIFSEINDIQAQYTPHGKLIKREYIYALSAKNNFDIPSYTLKAYSPKSKKYYTLSTKAHHITVTPIDTSTLIDKEDSPLASSFINIKELEHILIYIIIFLSGYFTAKFQPSELTVLLKWRKKSEIDTIYNAKELLYYLVKHHYNGLCKDEVELLEEMVYFKKKHNFKTIKMRVKKRIDK